MGCWKCGKKGDFSGQVCDKCFDKMEEEYMRSIEEGND